MSKTRTIDGERTRVDELNMGTEPAIKSGFVGRLQQWAKNLNLVMAGMYTGLNCYGTPKSHHEYDAKDKNSGQKPDRRPI